MYNVFHNYGEIVGSFQEINQARTSSHKNTKQILPSSIYRLNIPYESLEQLST